MFSLQRIDQICDEFERLWRLNNELVIEDFLTKNEEADNDQLLSELVILEIELRESVGKTPTRIEYEQRFHNHLHAVEKAFRRLSNSESPILARVLTAGQSFTDDLELGSIDVSNIPKRLGQFKILERIGQGKFGVVFRGFNEDTNETVALKFPRGKILDSLNEFQQFRTEAQLASTLDHPSIVKTWGILDVDRFVCIVQQFVSGKTLDIAQEQIQTDEEIAALLIQLSDAIAYAHSKGLIHRDLKPSNILIDEFGKPMIADFGLSIHESFQKRLRGQRCGTPAYMSPEQVMGLTHQMDGRSDIWSLGVIMYELLTKIRPFEGSTVEELFDEIKHRNEKPLRMRRQDLDREIQRICLKCLSKSIRDRYPSANELADDLKNWLKFRDKWRTTGSITLVPRGLKSFVADDANAFVELIPGPRNRDGIPECIQIWKTKLETPDARQPMSVGVIYGPSGSGKSSFIKAGLIPNLDPELIDTTYIEATPEDTEVRLIKALKTKFSKMPQNLSVPDIFDGIRNKSWSTRKLKTLIVIDQFEQWLIGNRQFEVSQLAHALRYCDGVNLSCILMIRDDYWHSVSRFLDHLGVDTREGDNAQRIDRFNKSHARKVLFLIGRALKKLPFKSTDLSKSQNEFLDQVVNDLAEDERIAGVHLTLFSEMFKHRDWNLEELRNIGGVSAVGTKFLEGTFESENASPHFKDIRQEAKVILEKLLPESAIDLKGKMQPDHILKKAAEDVGLHQFEQAVHILEQKLRIIERTEPNANQSRSSPNGGINEAHYQLTHDYLVPAIRNWLHKSKLTTWRGRAELRLRELGTYRTSINGNANIPNFRDFLQIRLGVPNQKISPMDKEWLSHASTIYWRRALAVLACLSIAILSLWIFNSNRWKRERNLRYDKFMEGSSTSAIESLTSLRPIANRLEKRIATDLKSNDPIRRARAGILFLQIDNGVKLANKRLAIDIADVESRVEFKFLTTELINHTSTLGDDFWEAFNQLDSDDPENPSRRERLAIAMLSMGDARGADSIYSQESDPTESTNVTQAIAELMPNTKEILGLIQNNIENTELQFGLMVAASNCKLNSWPDSIQKEWSTFIYSQHQNNPDSGVHGACKFLARKWGIELSAIQPTSHPLEGFDWWKVKIAPEIEMTFVKIRAGKFMRGINSPKNDYLAKIKYFPIEQVSIEKDFWIADCEAPFKLMRAWMDDQDPVAKDFRAGRRESSITVEERMMSAERTNNFFLDKNKDLPVFAITFREVSSVIEWLNKVAKNHNGYVYDLPSPDQWEFAVRNGSLVYFHFGDLTTQRYLSRYAVIKTIFEPDKDDTRFVELPYSRIPTRLGLFDTAGNLGEFTKKTEREYRIDETVRCFVKGGTFETPMKTAPGFTESSGDLIQFDYYGFRLILIEN